MDGFLILADGKTFQGHLNRPTEALLCHLAVNTATSGHAELMQNPALADQGLILTFPEVGNRGLSAAEAGRQPQIAALIVRQLFGGLPEDEDGTSWTDYCQQHDLTVLSGIDTRSLAAYLRENGSMNALICSERPTHFSDIRDEIINYQPAHSRSGQPDGASNPLEKPAAGDGSAPEGQLALVDYGLSPAFVERLQGLGYNLTIYQPGAAAEDIFAQKPQALLLSDGPETYLDDEKTQSDLSQILELAKAKQCPVVGLGLGHLLLAKSFGLRIRPLFVSGGGSSRPVVRETDGQIFQTTSHAGYTVDLDSLSGSEKVLFRHLNDETLEGIAYDGGLFTGYTFDPTTLVEPGVAQSVTVSHLLKG